MTPSKYEILTPDGWSDFHGVRRTKKTGSVKIVTNTGRYLQGTSDHRVYVKDKFIYLKDISIGDKIHTENGYEIVDNIYLNNSDEIYFYDALEVEKNNSYYTNGILSHNCDFIGSSNTLIPANILRNIKINHPIKSNAGLDVYEKPIPEHTYATVVDVSRGVSKDYSAFVVFDVTQLPYKIVAKYRNNEIKPLLFPQIIYETSMAYNRAYVLVEVNDIGEQVASAIHFDHEYDNMMQCSMRGRAGQVLGEGYSGAKVMLGVKTTKQVKKIGCSNLKQIIEDEKLVINDLDVIDELSTFALHGNTFKAEQGRNDDLVMCCVLFAWAAEQPYFKELTDIDIRKRMLKEQEAALEQDMAPFGFVSNGLEDSNVGIMTDSYGTRWSPISIEGGNW